MMVISWRNQRYLRFVDGLCRKMPNAKWRKEMDDFGRVAAVAGVLVGKMSEGSLWYAGQGLVKC